MHQCKADEISRKLEIVDNLASILSKALNHRVEPGELLEAVKELEREIESARQGNAEITKNIEEVIQL